MQLWKATTMIIGGLAWLGIAGCAKTSLQQGRIGNLEYALVEVRDRQDRMAEEFQERLESMERSLLQQERFLQNAFAVLETLESLNLLENEPEDLSRPDTGRISADSSAKAGDDLLGPAPAVSSLTVPRRSPEPEDRSAPEQLSSQTVPQQVPAQAFEPDSSPEPGGDEAKGLYDQALARYFNGEYVLARSDFLAFQERFPEHPLVPNALYWQAETHYAQKQFAQAILVFKELSRRFADSAKAADALLKAGFAYEQLGDYPNARFHLQIVLNDHPDTAAARLAMQRLPLLPPSRS